MGAGTLPIRNNSTTDAAKGDAAFHEGPPDRLQPPSTSDGVIIQVRHDRPARCAPPSISSMAQTGLRLVEVAHRSGTPRLTLHDGARVVGRAVIDHDDLDMIIDPLLCDHAVQCSGKLVRALMGADDHR